MYKILIVDDEKMIRMGMKNAIDWMKIGIDEVFTAASGNEALEILKKEERRKYEELIFNVFIPGISGLLG